MNYQLFNPFFSYRENLSPNVEIVDKANSYLLNIDVPGMNKEDIKIDLQDNVLTISGERVNKYIDDSFRSEISYGKFERSFNVKDVDQDEIIAKYDNGVLELELKKLAGKKLRSISVQ